MATASAGAGERGRLRLLAVHAHPDDETLATGGLLALWSDAGHHSCVVTCTRGEQGEVLPDDLADLEGDGPRLAHVRTEELTAALSHLGVTERHFLDELPPGGPLVDSGMQWVAPGIAGPDGNAGERAFSVVDAGESAARLAAFIRDFEPDVVVTYEPGGGYGHPDHIQASAVTTEAMGLADSTAVLLHAVIPVPVAVAAQAVLRGSEAVGHLMEASPELQFDALYDADVDTDALPPTVKSPKYPLIEADTVTVAARVRQALEAYATQVTAVTPLTDAPGVIGCAALSNNVLFPVLVREYYEVVSTGTLLAEIDNISGIRLVTDATDIQPNTVRLGQ